MTTIKVLICLDVGPTSPPTTELAGLESMLNVVSTLVHSFNFIL